MRSSGSSFELADHHVRDVRFVGRGVDYLAVVEGDVTGAGRSRNFCSKYRLSGLGAAEFWPGDVDCNLFSVVRDAYIVPRIGRDWNTAFRRDRNRAWRRCIGNGDLASEGLEDHANPLSD